MHLALDVCEWNDQIRQTVAEGFVMSTALVTDRASCRAGTDVTRARAAASVAEECPDFGQQSVSYE
jgi:hypothetical protein